MPHPSTAFQKAGVYPPFFRDFGGFFTRKMKGIKGNLFSQKLAHYTKKKKFFQ